MYLNVLLDIRELSTSLTTKAQNSKFLATNPHQGLTFKFYFQDIDAMPAHSLENMPEVMRRRFTPVEGMDRTLSDDSKLRTWNASAGVGGARAAFNERLERRFTMLSNRFLSDLSKRAQVCDYAACDCYLCDRVTMKFGI